MKLSNHPYLIVVKDWLSLIPPTAVTAGFVYVTYLAFCPQAGTCRKRVIKGRVNQKIKLGDAKVADVVDVEVNSSKSQFLILYNPPFSSMSTMTMDY